MNYRKTFWGSILAFFIGTSCCWVSSLLVWMGAATIVGSFSSLVMNAQQLAFAFGGILLLVTIFLYRKKRKSSN